MAAWAQVPGTHLTATSVSPVFPQWGERQAQENRTEYRKPASREWAVDWQNERPCLKAMWKGRTNAWKLFSDLHVGNVCLLIFTYTKTHTSNERRVRRKRMNSHPCQSHLFGKSVQLVSCYQRHEFVSLSFNSCLSCITVICLSGDPEWVFSGSTHRKQSTFSVTEGM